MKEKSPIRSRARKRGPGRPPKGADRRRVDAPHVALAVRGIPQIHAALKARFGFAPCLTTLYAILNGERDNERIVRTVAEMFPDAILPAVAARYGLPVNLSALGADAKTEGGEDE